MSVWLALGIAGLVIGLAAAVIFMRSAFGAVCAFIAYGLLLTLAWLQLRGVDVALTEAAIGGGLTGALLIGAAARLRPAPLARSTTAEPLARSTKAEPLARSTKAASTVAESGKVTLAFAAIAGAATTTLLAACVLALPDPAPTLAPQVAASIGVTGVGNAITAVLLAFRSMDTLLEAIVLLFALIGAWSLAPDASWPGRPGLRQSAPPNGIMAYIARLLPPIGLVVAAYVFWNGADEPGGKFQGATILAAMWLLMIAAGLSDVPRVGSRLLRATLVAGPLTFIAVGLFGIGSAGAFLGLPEAIAKPMIIVIELALLPTLTLILALLIPGPPQRATST
jgi:multisubunit Na+/H+ antiporter MnhB subunit